MNDLNAVERNAPAKINIGLHVLRRRADGYHDVATVLLHIPWHDRLTARPAADFTFTCSDPALPTDARNLCVQAAQALRAACGVTEGAALHLEKHLPYGAGLGGGSSDAAATLRLLARLWALDVPEARLHRLAAELGAVVPSSPGGEAPYATGRGDVLEPLRAAAEGEGAYRLPFALVVIAPEAAVATAEAYGWVTPRAEERPDLRAVVRSNDLARWQTELVNDFERPVFARHPSARRLKALLLDAGAGYASLSGSGAAVFGVFEDGAQAEAAAQAAAQAARQAGLRVWHGG